MRVATITPWLQHHELRPDYLAALEAGPWPDTALVVDNGGAPRLPGCVVVDAGGNLGFSGGSNLGLERVDTDAVVFLNNDVEATRDGWLNEIRAALEPGVLVGPLRHDRHADVDGRSFPYVDGWCLAGMTSDLREIGGWDAAFEEPSYFGDNDLCVRARAAGMTLRDLAVGLRHKLNATAAGDSRVQRATAINRDRYRARVRELLVTVP